MTKLMITSQLIWIFAVCIIAACSEHEPPDEHACTAGAEQCSVDVWTDWQICDDAGEWYVVDSSPFLCVDDHPRGPCEIGCEFGERLSYGDTLWTCRPGPECAGDYYQEGEK